jgi:hypothetical protein
LLVCLRLPCFLFLNLIYEGDNIPFAGVVDGGDIASVRFTAQAMNGQIRDQTCICHQLNNAIKRILTDYFDELVLNEWRRFIKRIHQSNPLLELWGQCCVQYARIECFDPFIYWWLLLLFLLILL